MKITRATTVGEIIDVLQGAAPHMQPNAWIFTADMGDELPPDVVLFVSNAASDDAQVRALFAAHGRRVHR